MTEETDHMNACADLRLCALLFQMKDPLAIEDEGLRLPTDL